MTCERNAADALNGLAARCASGPVWSWKAAAVTALLLIGCAQEGVRAPETPRPPAQRPAPPPVNLSGYSAAFKEGFQAGCDTARGRARRDEGRMQSDPQYAQGWQDGRSICAKR